MCKNKSLKTLEVTIFTIFRGTVLWKHPVVINVVHGKGYWKFCFIQTHIVSTFMYLLLLAAPNVNKGTCIKEQNTWTTVQYIIASKWSKAIACHYQISLVVPPSIFFLPNSEAQGGWNPAIYTGPVHTLDRVTCPWQGRHREMNNNLFIHFGQRKKATIPGGI